MNLWQKVVAGALALGLILWSWEKYEYVRTKDASSVAENAKRDAQKYVIEARDARARTRELQQSYDSLAKVVRSLSARKPEIRYVATTKVIRDTLVVVDSVPYIPLTQYDSLSRSCTLALSACDLALQSKDREITALDSARLAEQRASDAYRRQLKHEARRSVLRQVMWTGVGLAIGWASGKQGVP